jgi:hypothetical protein
MRGLIVHKLHKKCVIMKKQSFILSVCVLCLVFSTATLYAQWSPLRLPFGIYGFTNIEFHKNKTVTSFHTLGQIRFASSADNTAWALGKILTSNSPNGVSRTYSDGDNLYMFGWDLDNGVATAYRSLNDGSDWSNISLPAVPVYTFTPIGNALLCTSDSTVYRSSSGGNSWSQVLQVSSKISSIVRFSSSKLLFASSKNLYLSLDSGQVWTPIPPPYDTMGPAPSFLQIFPTPYATFLAFKNGSEMLLFRSTDGGNQWTPLALQAPFKEIDYIREIRSIGGVVWALFEQELARSDDGGANWTLKLIPKGSRCLQVKGSTLFAGGSLGFFKSLDVANSWLTGNDGWGLAGQNIGMNKQASALGAYQGRLYYAAADGLFSTANDGSEWRLHSSRSGFTQFLTSSDTLLFLNPEGILRSFNGGNTWDWVEVVDINGNTLINSKQYTRVGNYFFAMEFGDTHIYRSTDFGTSWELLPITISVFSKLIGFGEYLYMLDFGNVKRSKDYGQTFEDDEEGLEDAGFVERIWATEDQLYAESLEQLYRRDADGWTVVSSGLLGNDSMFVKVLDIAGRSGLTLLAGNHPSTNNLKPVIYQWDHSGQNWVGDLGQTLTANENILLALEGNQLYATAFDFINGGTRIWKRTITVPTHQPTLQPYAWHLFPNPSSDEAWIRLEQPPVQPVQVSVFDMTGRQVWSDEFLAGQTSLSIPVAQMPDGMYNVVLLASSGSLTQQRLLVKKP